jgi:uncharacterized protein (UPF0333 family)
MKLNKKAQISIEFIMIIAIFLLFFYSMILPTINFSETVLKDTYTLVQSKKSLTNLAENLEELSLTNGYGTRTFFLYLPESTYITGCDTTSTPYKIIAKTQVIKDPGTYYCDGAGLCDINVDVYVNGNLDCQRIPAGYKSYLTIEKAQNGDISFYD